MLHSLFPNIFPQLESETNSKFDISQNRMIALEKLLVERLMLKEDTADVIEAIKVLKNQETVIRKHHSFDVPILSEIATLLNIVLFGGLIFGIVTIPYTAMSTKFCSVENSSGYCRDIGKVTGYFTSPKE